MLEKNQEQNIKLIQIWSTSAKNTKNKIKQYVKSIRNSVK